MSTGNIYYVRQFNTLATHFFFCLGVCTLMSIIQIIKTKMYDENFWEKCIWPGEKKKKILSMMYINAVVSCSYIDYPVFHILSYFL